MQEKGPRNQYDHYLPKTRTELERRITMMESDDYDFPPRIQKADWIGLLLVVIVSLAIVCGLMLYCSAL